MMRERLVELICEGVQTDYCVGSCGKCESISDHLLANGVIVVPCKPGDIVYRIYDSRIIRHKFDWDMVPELYKTIFPTHEEAERALKGGS